MTTSALPPAAEPAIAFGSSRARWVVAGTVLGSGLAFIDATVVNVALPSIGDSLNAGLSSLTPSGGLAVAHSDRARQETHHSGHHGHRPRTCVTGSWRHSSRSGDAEPMTRTRTRYLYCRTGPA